MLYDDKVNRDSTVLFKILAAVKYDDRAKKF